MVPADELCVDLQIIVRGASDAGLAAEHVHHFRIAIHPDEQARRAFGQRFVCPAHRRVQSLHALLDLPDEHRAVGGLIFQSLNELIAVAQRDARFIDPRVPFVIGPLQLIEAGVLVAQVRFEPVNGLFRHTQIGFQFLGPSHTGVGIRLQGAHRVLLLIDTRFELLDALFAGGDFRCVLTALRGRLLNRRGPLLHLRAYGHQLAIELHRPFALRRQGYLVFLDLGLRLGSRFLVTVPLHGDIGNSRLQLGNLCAQPVPLFRGPLDFRQALHRGFAQTSGSCFEGPNPLRANRHSFVEHGEVALQLLAFALHLQQLLVPLRERGGERVDLFLQMQDSLGALIELQVQVACAGVARCQLRAQPCHLRLARVDFQLQAGKHVVKQVPAAFSGLQHLEVARRMRTALAQLQMYGREDALVLDRLGGEVGIARTKLLSRGCALAQRVL